MRTSSLVSAGTEELAMGAAPRKRARAVPTSRQSMKLDLRLIDSSSSWLKVSEEGAQAVDGSGPSHRPCLTSRLRSLRRQRRPQRLGDPLDRSGCQLDDPSTGRDARERRLHGRRSRSHPSIDVDPTSGRVFVVYADYAGSGTDADSRVPILSQLPPHLSNGRAIHHLGRRAADISEGRR
jgi:hypothetical protein